MKKTNSISLLAACLLAGAFLTEAEEPSRAPAEAVEHWQDLRFGMFIHWGPVALTGHEIGWSRGSQTPIEKYDQLYKRFNPTEFNAREWVETARAAGMKYIVLTSKHHDGFCLWDSAATEYDIMNSPFGRDVVAELAAACRAAGMDFGLYYSTCDWWHPAFPNGGWHGRETKPTADLQAYDRYLRAQTRELIENYGPLLTIWFDVPQSYDQKFGEPMVADLRRLQPDLLINNRAYSVAGRHSGIGHQEPIGDYDTPEQKIGAFQIERPWETCMTLCRQWAWKPNDQMKSVAECLRILIQTIGGDGNLLFNVGPMPDGRIEPRQVERLREMGDWVRAHGEAIYGTRGGPFKPGAWGASTRKGDAIHLFVSSWPRRGGLRLPAIDARIVTAELIGGGDVDVETDKSGIVINVPEESRSAIATVIKLSLSSSAMDIAPLDVPGPASGSLAKGGSATASNTYQGMQAEYGPQKAFDDEPKSRWASDAGTRSAWIEVDLGVESEVGSVYIDEAFPGRIEQFELQYLSDDVWRKALAGTSIGADFEAEFPPVRTRRFRLAISAANEGPSIKEFQLY